MVQTKALGVFSAPAPLPNRIRPVQYTAPKEIEVLPPTTSAAIRPITALERSLLQFLARLSDPILRTTELNTLLQEVKTALFNKEYEKAFGGREDYREVYVARWVPSRVLVYRRVLRESRDIIMEALVQAGAGGDEPTRVICLGGGAGSEVIALGSLLERVGEEGWKGKRKVEVIAVDNSDWSTVLRKQEEGMLEEWPTLRGQFAVKFVQADVLASVPSAASTSASDSVAPTLVSTIPYASSSLITILFTISELLLQSRASTILLLHHLTSLVAPSTLLLIIESASLASIPIGTAGRTYPLSTLLDHTLSEDKPAAAGGKAKWEKVRAEESTWYRMPEGVRECYPLKLENTRVVIRLYRRC